jgi:hypothetical protein
LPPLPNCPTDDALVFVDVEGGVVCAQADVEPSTLRTVTLSGFQSTSSEVSSSVAATFDGQYHVVSYVANDVGAILDLKLVCSSASCGVATITLTRTSQQCSQSDIEFNEGSNRKRASGFVGGALFVALATGGADPHFRGPNGERFDFSGQPRGVYVLAADDQVTRF